MAEQRFVESMPIGQLSEHPENARRGDVDAISSSIDAHGFYGAVLVQASTGHVIAGNHRLRAARSRGIAAVPALVLDVDDDEARRIMLVDNRTNDVAGYDDGALLALLESLNADVTLGLAGTGYDETDLARLIAQLEPQPLDDDDVRPLDRSNEHECPICQARWIDTPDGPQQL